MTNFHKNTTNATLVAKRAPLTESRFNARKARLLININRSRFLLRISELGSAQEAFAAKAFYAAKREYRKFKRTYGTRFAV